MSYTIYKQGIAQGNIALVNDKIQCGPTLEMVKETGPTGYQSWMNTHLSLNRLIESMRLPKQSDADLYASLGTRLSGFLYAVEQYTPATKGGPGSGNFGHAGRPGLVGGSQSFGTGIVLEETVDGMLKEKDVDLQDQLRGKKFKQDRFSDHFSYILGQNEDAEAKHTVCMAIYQEMNRENGYDVSDIAGLNMQEYESFSEEMARFLGIPKGDLHLKYAIDHRKYILGKWPMLESFIGYEADIKYVTYSDVKKAVAQWASTSNDEDLRSYDMQEAAASFSGSSLTDWQKERRDRVIQNRKGNPQDFRSFKWHHLFEQRLSDNPNSIMQLEFRSVEQAKEMTDLFARTMYKTTQKQLEQIPGDTIRVYRGFFTNNRELKNGGKVQLIQNPLESWSTSFYVARSFARDGGLDQLVGTMGFVVAMDVPKSRIFSTPNSGIGSLIEMETVVLGFPEKLDESMVVFQSREKW